MNKGKKICLDTKKLFLIDLNGTIYLGNRLIPGAKEFVTMLKKTGKTFYFLSNDSARNRSDLVKKLSSLSLNLHEEQLIISTDSLIYYLIKEKIYKTYVMGTKSLKDEIKRHDIEVDSVNPQFVIIGYDRDLTYQRLAKTLLFLHKGIPLLATHCDKIYLSPEGPLPDVGSFLTLIKDVTQTEPVKTFGKPNTDFILHLLSRHRVSSNEIVVFGDSLNIDMKLAKNLGCDFVLVLTGETSRADLEKAIRVPDLILESLEDIPKLLKLAKN